MAFRKTKRSILKKRSTRRRTSRKTGVSRRIKNYVQRTINRDTETKHQTLEISPANYNGAATSAGDIIQVMPIINNGDGSYNKEGQVIRLKSLNTKGFIKWQANSFAEDNIYACIWSVEDKLQKNFNYTQGTTPTTTYPNDIFAVLLNTFNEPTPPNGDWNEIGYRLNTKRFKIKRKIIRLTPNYPSQSTVTPHVVSEGVGESFKMFSFKRYFGKSGKVCRYPAFTSSFPENYNPYMFITFFGSSATGGYSSLSNIQVVMACTTLASYEDA